MFVCVYCMKYMELVLNRAYTFIFGCGEAALLNPDFYIIAKSTALLCRVQGVNGKSDSN